jgi:predicted TIM-barrel fold metal-dependent hydrolase
MIIDVHCHIWGDEIRSEAGKQMMKQVAAQGHPLTFPLNQADTPLDALLLDMDAAKVDKIVILGMDGDVWFKRVGEDPWLPFDKYNDYIAKLVKEYPDRFIGFAGIDPRRGRVAIREVERCVNQLGLKGVKLWQLHGFYPDDSQFYPFYERVEQLGIPILYHTGSGPVGTYLKYCRPAYVNTVATDFPSIPFICAHMGDPWVDEAIAAATFTPNLYLDLAYLGNWYAASPIQFIRTIAQAKLRCGIEKIVFGSDWPLFPQHLTYKNWVDAIRTMTTPDILKQLGFPEITEHDKQLILGDNAAKILGI